MTLKSLKELKCRTCTVWRKVLKPILSFTSLVEGDISLADTDDADMGNDDTDGDCDVNVDTKHTHQLDSGTTHQNPSSGDNRPTIFARLLRRSLNRYESTMYLNLYGRHFSFISNIEKYTKSYICDKCRKLWKTGKQLNRHVSSCKGDGTQYRYPGGFYVTRRPFLISSKKRVLSSLKSFSIIRIELCLILRHSLTRHRSLPRLTH